MRGFTTRAIHGGTSRKDGYGALRMPVYDSVAFEHESAEAIRLAFEGKKPAHTYSRISNPTVEDFEQRLRLLSGGLAVLALSSGMAAISNTILALAGSGTNIVASRFLFGNTMSLLEKTLRPWGLEIRLVNMTRPQEVAGAIDSATRLIFMESVTNPQLEVADCRKIAAIAADSAVPLVVDNTLMTPYLFNVREAGGNIELLSTTKYISGGATSVGGVIIDHGNFNWRNAPRMKETARNLGQMAFMASLRREIFRNVGSCISPHNAYLQSLGLESMGLRIDRSCENALALANFLARQSGVAAVNYPGLADSPAFTVANRQFRGKFGGLLTFDLHSGEACRSFIDALQLIRRATNVNDNKSLILHPASTLFAEYTEAEKSVMAVRPTMLRLSVGIEDHEDLIEDLERGLKEL